MNYSSFEIWTIIILMGIGTFLLRFSFMGMIGDRDLPPFVLRMLRYTAVAVLPGIVAPLVVWPAVNNGEIEPMRLTATVVTLLLGVFTRNMMLSLIGGASTLALMTWLM